MTRALPFPESAPPLRWYQDHVLDVARGHIAEGRYRILVQLATGLGKTRLAVEAARKHVALGGIVLFIAPRRELVAQATLAIVSVGLSPDHDVFVRTIQELTRPGAFIPPATLVILDEARHYVADGWSQILERLPDAVYLGLDATPERGDGRGLGDMFDEIVEAVSVKDATDAGFLVPCEVLRPERPLLAGELAQDPVDVYLDKAPGSRAVVFCSSVEESKEVARQFRLRGVYAEAVWGEMPWANREMILRDFAKGTAEGVRVLTNMHLLTEGWDAPIAETIILARHFPTPGNYLQAVGRGLRPHPGKTRCLLLDLVGCTHIHGEPDEPRTWHLHGRAAVRQSVAADVRFCPVCGAVAPLSMTCQSCGYDGDERRKRKPRVLGLPVDRFVRQRQESDEQKAKKLAFYLGDARRAQRHMYSALKRFEGVYGHMPTPAIKRLARTLG